MNEDAQESTSSEQPPREPWGDSRAATARDQSPAGMPTFEPLDPLVPDVPHDPAANSDHPPAPLASGAPGLYVPDESDEPAADVQWYQSSGRPGELAWLADNFATSFAAAAGGLLRADLKVRLAAVAETARRQFTDAVEDPTCAYSLVASTAGPGASPGETCLEFSPAIAAELVQRLMGARDDGGASGTDIPSGPQRPLTGAERRVLRHLANLVALGLSVSRPGGTRGEMRAELAPPAGDPQDRVVVATFELSLAGRVGTMRLCGPGRLADATRAGRARRTTAGPLEITAAIDAMELDATDLAAMEVGDILDTELPADSEVLVRIAGIPKFAGRLNVVEGRRVITITRRLGPAGA